MKIFEKVTGGGYSRQALAGISWVGALRVATRSIAFFKTAILARILLPAQFGIYGVATLTLELLETLTETGINIILVQEKRGIDRYVDTAWAISIARGLIISTLIILLAPFVSGFFRLKGAGAIIYLTALVPFIRGFINPAVAKMQKELEFKKEFKYKFPIYTLDALVSIALSLATKSPTSLIWGLVAGAVLEVFISFVFILPRPKFALERVKLKKVISRGKWITAYGIFNYAYENIDDMAVARILNQSALGIYQVAYKISSLPITEVSQVFGRVTFPLYRKIADDKKRLRKAFLKATLMMAVLIIPFSALIFLFSRQIVLIVLGPNWLGAVGILKLLAIHGGLRGLSYPLMSVFLAVNKQEYITWVTLLGLSALGLTIIPLINLYGIIGAGIATIIASLVSIPLIACYLFKIFR